MRVGRVRNCGRDTDHDSGLDKYEEFLSASLEKPSSYNPGVLREIMDGFREVLFR